MPIPSPLKFLRDERGMIMPLAGVMVLLGIGFASLAIDMGYLYYLRGKVQTTADAAALAGAGQIPNMSDIRKEAISLARQNLPEDENGEVVTEANSCGFQIEDESHLIMLLEQEQREAYSL